MAYTTGDIVVLKYTAGGLWEEVKLADEVSGGDLVVTKFDPDGIKDGFTGEGYISYTPVWIMVENTCGLYVTAKVPAGATSINSIKIYYYSTGLINGNLYMRYSTAHWNTDIASVVETDELAEAAYDAGGGAFYIDSITIPSTAYNGLTNIDANDIISLYIERLGSDLADTYNGDFKIFGVEFTFA